jgi:hypothetical protein
MKRLLVDLATAIRERLIFRLWSKEHLAKQNRSSAAQYASMGRFRESSTLTVDSDERWDRYERDYPAAKAASRYLRENCCDHYSALGEQCPICMQKESK